MKPVEDNEEDQPSKSQIKRECDALQKMGEDLLKLKASDLDEMKLPEKLEEAIQTARKIQSRSGLKRQRQFIGKIMREIDSDLVKKQLDEIRHKHDTNTVHFRKLEQWRDRLIANDKLAMAEIIETHPQIDRQHINQLVRQAKYEAEKNKPPAAARKLFKYLDSLEN